MPGQGEVDLGETTATSIPIPTCWTYPTATCNSSAASAFQQAFPNFDFSKNPLPSSLLDPTGNSTTRFFLTSCADAAKTICSRTMSVTAQIGGLPFQGNYRQFAPTVGGSQTVTWSKPAGSNFDYYSVAAPTASTPGEKQVFWNGNVQNTATVPTSTAGAEDVHLLTCILNPFTPSVTCGPALGQTKVPTGLSGQLKLTSWLNPDGTPATGGYGQIAGEWASASTPVAQVTDGNGTTHSVTAGTTGFLDLNSYAVPSVGSVVQSSQFLSSIDSGSTIELVVGTSGANGTTSSGNSASFHTASLTSAPFSNAYSKKNVYPADEAGTGATYAAAIDPQNQHVFWDSEFSSALGEADPTVSNVGSAVTGHEEPVANATSTTLLGG
jgi:hypothetical protein